jgi:hypothetical protein
MLGIDLLGDLPGVVEVTEAEVEAEAYLRDRARRLGQPLDAVRRDLTRKKKQRMRQMKQTTTSTTAIAYTNRGREARAERTLRWYRAWERGRVHRALQCVGLSVFSFLAPWHGERIRAGRDLARVAVLAEEPDHQQPQSHQPQASSSSSIEWEEEMEGMDHVTAGAEGKYHDDDDDELDAHYHHPRMAKRFSPSSTTDSRHHESKSKRRQQSQQRQSQHQRQQHHRHSPWMQEGGGASTRTAQEDSTYAPPDYDGDFSDMDDDSMV